MPTAVGWICPEGRKKPSFLFYFHVSRFLPALKQSAIMKLWSSSPPRTNPYHCSLQIYQLVGVHLQVIYQIERIYVNLFLAKTKWNSASLIPLPNANPIEQCQCYPLQFYLNAYIYEYAIWYISKRKNVNYAGLEFLSCILSKSSGRTFSQQFNSTPRYIIYMHFLKRNGGIEWVFCR